MSVWDLRQAIEESIPAWVILAFTVVAIVGFVIATSKRR